METSRTSYIDGKTDGGFNSTRDVLADNSNGFSGANLDQRSVNGMSKNIVWHKIFSGEN